MTTYLHPNVRPVIIVIVSCILLFLNSFPAQLYFQDTLIDSEYWLGGKFKENLDNTNERQTDWAKVLVHEDFPKYKIKLNEPTICDPSVKQYSGYLDAGKAKHFFFWFFESRNNPKTDPIVLWLNGGPGCSSLTGLYIELGPCMVNEEGTDTVFNPHSWNSNTSIIFLDQPVNAGYSYGSDVSNTISAAADVYAFLQIFFNEFPQYSNLDFHIAGESYAGHYIPAIASEINDNNEGTSSWILATKPKNLRHVNLNSIMIGNGLVDPKVQYKYYPDMACNSSYDPVLDESTCDHMRKAYPRCARSIQKCYDNPNMFNCVPATISCNRDMIQPYQQTGMNVYDVRKKCEGGNLCYPILDAIEKYSNREDVKKELGVHPRIEYKSCNMNINFRFMMSGDWMRPYHRLIPPLLEKKIRLLVYAGDADYICNWIGNEAWVKELQWPGKDGFNAVDVKPWLTHNESLRAGEVRSYKELTFLRIFEAGHMVPYDQPRPSLDFFNRWLLKESLS